jgi:hypothetical protein
MVFSSIKDVNMIWLIKFKAAMGVSSSLNMDGSDSIYATAVVFADTGENAKAALQDYLRSDHIALHADEINAEQYRIENLEGSDDEIADIKQCASRVNEENPIALANAISSEAYEYLESARGGE